MEILLTASYTAFFVFLIGKINFFNIEGIPNRNLKLVFILKIISGFVLSLIYTYYYTNRLTADTFKYFDDSRIIYDLFYTDKKTFFQFMFGFPHENATYMHYSNEMHNWWNRMSLYNESRTITRLNVVMRFFSMGYYQVHNVFFCFLSLAGLTALVKLFFTELKHYRKQIFVMVFLFPSIIFWGSGILKDGLLFFCVGMALYYANLLHSKTEKNILNLIFCVLFLGMVFFVKVHVFFIFLPCYLAYIWSTKNHLNTGKKFISIFALYIILLLSFSFINKNINFVNYLVAKQYEFINLAKEASAGSLIHLNQLEPNIWSIIKNSPVAFLNTLSRPHLLESRSPFILLSAIENTIIIISIALILFFGRSDKEKYSPLFFFSLFYFVSLYTLIGLITPVMGAIVRYKIQVLPFLFFILLKFLDKDKLVRKFPFIKILIS